MVHFKFYDAKTNLCRYFVFDGSLPPVLPTAYLNDLFGLLNLETKYVSSCYYSSEIDADVYCFVLDSTNCRFVEDVSYLFEYTLKLRCSA